MKKIKETALPLLKDRRRILTNKIKAMDKIFMDGRITIISLNKICRGYKEELKQIKREIKRRTGNRLTHTPFAEALRKKS